MSEDSREKGWNIYVKISFGILLLFGVSAIAFAIYAVVQYIQTFETFFPAMETQVPVDTSEGSITIKQAESVSDLRGQFGTLGDVMGGLLNPVLTFATFIVLIATILIQLKELRFTREELKNSNEQLKMSREEQAKTAVALEEQSRTQRKQQFESTFFSLLGMISERSRENERILEAFFIVDWDDFFNGPHGWAKNRRKSLGRKDHEFIAQSADYFFNLLGLIQGLDDKEDEFFYSELLINSTGRFLVSYIFIIIIDIHNDSRLLRSPVLKGDYNFEGYCVFKDIDFSLFSPSIFNYDCFNGFVFMGRDKVSVAGRSVTFLRTDVEPRKKFINMMVSWNNWLIDGVNFIGQKAFFGNFRVVEQYESIRMLNIKAMNYTEKN